MNEIDITTIRYVCAIARHNSFSRAAEALFITQPSLSQAIQRLESSLGYPLFERSTRRISLTEEGRMFIEQAEPLLAQYEEFQKTIAGMQKQKTPSLSVGLLPTFMELHMSQILTGFQEKHPEYHLSLEMRSTRRLLHMLETGAIDIAVCYLSQSQLDEALQKYECTILEARQIHVLMHKDNPLSSHNWVSISSLKDETVYTLEKKSATETEVLSHMQEMHLTPAKLKSSPAFPIMIGTIAMNQGICFHSYGVGTEYIHQPLISLPLMPAVRMYVTMISFKQRRKDPLIQTFCDYFKAEYSH